MDGKQCFVARRLKSRKLKSSVDLGELNTQERVKIERELLKQIEDIMLEQEDDFKTARDPSIMCVQE